MVCYPFTPSPDFNVHRGHRHPKTSKTQKNTQKIQEKYSQSVWLTYHAPINCQGSNLDWPKI